MPSASDPEAKGMRRTMTEDTNATGTCCSTGAPHPAASAEGRPSLLHATDEPTTCPVMVGTPVDRKAAEAAGLFRDHDGRRYHFCCAGCAPAFDADPARYAAHVA